MHLSLLLRTRMRPLAVFVAGAGLVLASCSNGDDDDADDAAAEAASDLEEVAPGDQPEVLELMAAADCDGGVVAPEPGTDETGRCVLPDGSEVTVAVFASDAGRASWVDDRIAAGQLVAAAPEWAAAAVTAEAANAFGAANGLDVPDTTTTSITDAVDPAGASSGATASTSGAAPTTTSRAPAAAATSTTATTAPTGSNSGSSSNSNGSSNSNSATATGNQSNTNNSQGVGVGP